MRARTVLQILALAWAALLFCGNAKASTTEHALEALCPRHMDLAPFVDVAARRHLVRAEWLVANMAAESQCNPKAVNRRTGAVGLLQILPKGSANPTHLSIEALKDPAINLDLGARHLASLFVLCGALGPATHVYHGHARCRGWRDDPHVRRVCLMLQIALRWIAEANRG